MKEVKIIKKVIIWTLLAIVFLHPFVYWKFSHLTKDDLTWMEPYNEGDTVLFVSSSDMDTMVVREKPLHNSFWPFRENEGSSEYVANGSIKYIIKHDGKSVDGRCIIFREGNGRLYVGFTLQTRRLHYEDDTKICFDSIKIKNSVYTDVIKISDSNSSSYSVGRIANEYFIWSKSKGLLQYKYLNGDVYTFYKKLPYKKKGWFQ